MADQAARTEAVRLGPRIAIRIVRVERSVLGRLDLMIAPAISSSARQASNDARGSGSAPYVHLREQTSRRPHVEQSRKPLKIQEIVWNRRADSNR